MVDKEEGEVSEEGELPDEGEVSHMQNTMAAA
jgi:hypothetical protein